MPRLLHHISVRYQLDKKRVASRRAIPNSKRFSSALPIFRVEIQIQFLIACQNQILIVAYNKN